MLVSPKLWPRATLVWSIAYNTELVKNPPKSWMDLTKPEYGNGVIGQVIGPSGGTTWTRIMFERQVLGEDYWEKQAATKPVLYPSGAPLSDALVRGEVQIAPLLYNIVWTKKRDGAPVEIFFPPEGVPINPYASGIPKTAAHPNAARLFLNWCLSEEGQTFMIKELGNLTSLKKRAGLSRRLRPQGGQGLGARISSSTRSSTPNGWRNGTRPTAIGSEPSGAADVEIASMSAELRVEQLRKVFATGRPAVDDVSFRVAAGEIVVLLGPSGCGKTTTLRCVAGLEQPTAGTIAHRRRRRLGAGARRPAAAAPAQHRHGVPVLRRVAAHDGVAERGLSAAHAPPRARRARPARSTRCWRWSASRTMRSGR